MANLKKLSLALVAVAALAFPQMSWGQDVKEKSDSEILKEAKQLQTHFIQLVKKLRPSVAAIRVKRSRRGRAAWGGGSGVIIDKNGYILTNDHVVQGASEIWVGLPGKPLKRAKLLGVDKLGDIAMIKIAGNNHPAVQMGESKKLRVGQWVFAMGNPFSLAERYYSTVTQGIISGLGRVQGGSRLYGAAIQTDASINPGNSGGPLFDMHGRLIGINGRISIREGRRVNVGVGYAIPIHQIKNFLPALKAGKKVKHGYLGIQFSTELKDQRQGVKVERVMPNTSAYKNGIRAGDIIVEFDGQKITSYSRLQNAISVLPAGRKVKFKVRRKSKVLMFEVELGERPAR